MHTDPGPAIAIRAESALKHESDRRRELARRRRFYLR